MCSHYSLHYGRIRESVKCIFDDGKIQMAPQPHSRHICALMLAVMYYNNKKNDLSERCAVLAARHQCLTGLHNQQQTRCKPIMRGCKTLIKGR